MGVWKDMLFIGGYLSLAEVQAEMAYRAPPALAAPATPKALVAGFLRDVRSGAPPERAPRRLAHRLRPPPTKAGEPRGVVPPPGSPGGRNRQRRVPRRRRPHRRILDPGRSLGHRGAVACEPRRAEAGRVRLICLARWADPADNGHRPGSGQRLLEVFGANYCAQTRT